MEIFVAKDCQSFNFCLVIYTDVLIMTVLVEGMPFPIRGQQCYSLIALLKERLLPLSMFFLLVESTPGSCCVSTQDRAIDGAFTELKLTCLS